MLAPFSTTHKFDDAGGRKANPAGLRMPNARSLPEKKSWGGVWEEEAGREKERIWDRPEDGSRAVRSILEAREEETRREVGFLVGYNSRGRVVSSSRTTSTKIVQAYSLNS
jgi:hypothetical protein